VPDPDDPAHPNEAILAVAIRLTSAGGPLVTAEILIPRDGYDPLLVLDLVERCGVAVH